MNESAEFSIGNDVTMRPGAKGAPGRVAAFNVGRDVSINNDVTMADISSAKSSARFRSGDEILGRYVVESELGQGGMGVVYLCLDKVSGVKVAVKGLPPEVSHNSDEMEEVRDNFQLVSELQHPNIAGVRTLEKDASTGDYFLVMSYASGVSLKSWLRKHSGKAHRGEQLKVLRQIASALDYAHNAEPRHIIHRDIKPENVMVDEHGNAMVLDFGLAAQVRSSLSRVSQIVTSRSGTPAYKSPEQWLAQAQRAPSDQYSLGVIAYQMFAGELPFDSDDIEILKHAVAFDPVPEIAGESKVINSVFVRVLAKKPQERFDSCTAFVDALEGRSGESKSGSRGGRVAVVVGLLSVVAAVVVGWWLWRELAKSDERAHERIRQAAIARREAKHQKEEAERLAAEKAEAERKAKALADRIAEDRRKEDEARRLTVERAESARKAKEETERMAEEKAKVAVAERNRRRETIARKLDDVVEPKDEARKAIELFKKGDWQAGLLHANKADQSDAELQFWIATCYDMGLGANCDPQKAVTYFRRAAELGQVDAQCELARRYESGQGVGRDLTQAKRWYQAAASKGSTAAEQSLRRLYEQENVASATRSSSQSSSLAERRMQRKQAQAEDHALEVEKVREQESESLEKLKREVAALRATAKNAHEESLRKTARTTGRREVSLSNRTEVRFKDASTLSQLTFSTPSARQYYVQACELAQKGAHNKAQVKEAYNTGRTCGGPEWPELEAWLDWWR